MRRTQPPILGGQPDYFRDGIGGFAAFLIAKLFECRCYNAFVPVLRVKDDPPGGGMRPINRLRRIPDG